MNKPRGYHLLPIQDFRPHSPDPDNFPPSSHPRQKLPSIHLVIYTILLLSNIILLSLYLKSSPSPSCIRPFLIPSPAKSDHAIHYVKRRLWRDISPANPFTGPPRPEHDAAWKKIIEPLTIKITPTELARLNSSSIPFADNSGSIAETAVYHELHCVKRVRRYLHLEHYYPNLSAQEREIEDRHIDHCLEYWREAAMCRGDTALSTFRWGADGTPYSRVDSEHECVEWEGLDKWARGRMVDMAVVKGELVGG